jgi:adenylate cyclase
MKGSPGTSLEFEGFILDLSRGCLRHADGEIELRPKSFELLRTFVENPGRLLGKEELLSVVWPNVTVTEEALTHCVSEVRRALNDRGQKIVKTVPKRGYLFACAVRQTNRNVGLETGQGEARDVNDERGPSSSAGAPTALRDRPSIAVLPFINMSGDPAQEYFSDGITEDIVTELSRFSELRVIARNSSFQYKGRAIDIRQVGRELGVDYVLEGSIRRVMGRVRINAQLLDALTGTHRWAERYDRELDDVFAVQDEVARQIVAVLAAHVYKAETERSLNKPPASWAAYDYYMRGTEVYDTFSRTRSVEHVYEARRLLEQSLSLDPNYARACAKLAQTYVSTYIEPLNEDYLNPSAIERAHALVNKAAQLDPNLPLAHFMRGWVLLWLRQHEAAISASERALSLNPNFASGSWTFAMVLTFAGQSARAVELIQASRRLDPFHPPQLLAALGHAHYLLRRYAEAVPPLCECASRAPKLRIVPLWLAATHAQLGHLNQARAKAAEVLRMEPNFTIGKFEATAVYKDLSDVNHLFEGLRKAGLPE